MTREKRQRLERAGWTVGSTAEFLGLSAQESRFIELKLALASDVRRLRERRGMTQAGRGSSSRVEMPLNQSAAGRAKLVEAKPQPTSVARHHASRRVA